MPIEDAKQLHGVPLKIINFYVDIIKGTISLSPNSIDGIVDKWTNSYNTPVPTVLLNYKIDWSSQLAVECVALGLSGTPRFVQQNEGQAL